MQGPDELQRAGTWCERELFASPRRRRSGASASAETPHAGEADLNNSRMKQNLGERSGAAWHTRLRYSSRRRARPCAGADLQRHHAIRFAVCRARRGKAHRRSYLPEGREKASVLIAAHGAAGKWAVPPLGQWWFRARAISGPAIRSRNQEATALRPRRRCCVSCARPFSSPKSRRILRGRGCSRCKFVLEQKENMRRRAPAGKIVKKPPEADARSHI